MSGYKSRFDWYQATLEGLEDHEMRTALVMALGGTVTRGSGKFGYAVCDTHERDGKVLARVFYGAASRPGEVHVSVTGDACDEVVPLLRRKWPEHRVSRVDVAVDFAAEFEQLDARALQFAKDRGLSYRLVTDSDGGATRYIGAVSSEFMVRVYKKSEQMRKKHPEQAAEVPDGIVRAEKQVRPNTRMKGQVAQMTPDEVWGIGKWPSEFAAAFLDLETEVVPTHFRVPSDWSKGSYWMGRQYSPMIAARVAEVGREQAEREVLALLFGEGR